MASHPASLSPRMFSAHSVAPVIAAEPTSTSVGRMDDWRTGAGTTFETYKQAATGSQGMVVTNHPLGSSAGLEMLVECRS